jgi:hypothetical protein
MLGRGPFVLPIIAIAASLSGCASPSGLGALSDYWGVGYTHVTTTCGGGYQVYRKSGEPKILVVAYPISEARKSFCESYNGIRPSPSVTGVRYEEGALEYLARTPDLKSCTLAGGTELTGLHSEFVIACPRSPAGAITAKG